MNNPNMNHPQLTYLLSNNRNRVPGNYHFQPPVQPGMYQARGFPVPMFQQPVRQAFNPMSLPYNGPRHNEPPMNLPVAPIGQENQAPNHFQEPMPYNGAALMAPPPMNLPVAPIGQENQAPISSNHYQAPLPYNGAAPMPYTPVSTSGRSFGQEHPMVAPPLPANPPPLEDQTPNRGTIRFQIPKTEPAEPTSFVHRPQIKKEPMEEEDVRYIGTIGGSLAMELRNLRAKEARRMREQEQRAAVIAPEAPVAAEQGEDAPAPVPAPAPAPEITEMFQKMVDFMATQNAFMQQLMTQGHSAPQELAQPARRGRKPALEGTAVSDAFEAAPRGRKRSSKPTERKKRVTRERERQLAEEAKAKLKEKEEAERRARDMRNPDWQQWNQLGKGKK